MKERKLLQLVEGAIRGDRNAFSELMQLKAKNVLFISLSLMNERESAEDAAQNAMISISENITSLKSAEAFDSWMYKIVFNTCMYEKRKMGKKPANIELIPEEIQIAEERRDFLPEDYLMSESNRAELREALQDLPHTYRMCLMLFYYEEMSYAQIAEAMDLSVQDVTNVLSRAKKKLHEKLLAKTPGAVEGTSDNTPLAYKGAGLASVPVLTQFFVKEADALITPDLVNHFYQAAVAQSYLMPAAAAATTATAATAATTATVAAASTGILGSISGKVVFAGAAVLLTAGIGVASFNALSNENIPAPSAVIKEEPATIEEEVVTPEPEQKPAIGEEETKAPSTDSTEITNSIIGEQNTQALEAFTSEEKPVSTWRDFAEQAGLDYVEHVLDQNYRYDVYTAENEEQQTRLVTIVRSDEAGVVSMVKKAGSITMDIPTDTYIVAAFEEWQE